MTSFVKTPIIEGLNNFASSKINDAFQIYGKALPCSVVKVVGPIVTVKFEIDSSFTIPQITMPIMGSEYIRLPIQVGCKGVAFPADVYIGGISGLGGGTASFDQRANLATLVFFPVSSKSFSPSDDPNSLVLYGPNGVIIRDIGSKSKLSVRTGNVNADTPSFNASQNLTVGTGVTGTITPNSIASVADGIVISIN